MVPPPRDLAELAARVRALAGRTLSSLAAEHGLPFAGRTGARTKGKTGELVEQVLGATGGSAAVHDFPALGVELKTIPVDLALRPRESTYVCKLPLADVDRAEWATSWVRAKLARVLWIPIVAEADEPRVGEPLFWEPTAEQSAILAADFEELMGTIATAGIGGLAARQGRWLHVRPKAARGSVRTWVPVPHEGGAEGGDLHGPWEATVPRGFYLRSRFTRALLRDSLATP